MIVCIFNEEKEYKLVSESPNIVSFFLAHYNLDGLNCDKDNKRVETLIHTGSQ